MRGSRLRPLKASPQMLGLKGGHASAMGNLLWATEVISSNLYANTLVVL